MTFHNIKMKSIDGELVDFSQYQGTQCLVVNVASECGLTRQYRGLQALHAKHQAEGFTVLGFPCNQFGAQEPGSDEEIREFAEGKFGVEFPMFSKIEVNGDGACELYKWLTSEKSNPEGAPDVAWNFTKFLIDAEGNVVERFEPGVTPESISEKLSA